MKPVYFTRLDPRAAEPTNAYGESAGWDLPVLEDTIIPVGCRSLVRSGIAMALPSGTFARIIGRSSAAARYGLIVIEGLIDEGFRGELFAGVYNPGWLDHVSSGGTVSVDRRGAVRIPAGASLAQVIVQEVQLVEWREAETLPPSVRGVRGFGSSDEVKAHA